MMTERRSILELDGPALKEWCESRRQPGYRSRQILEWLYQKEVLHFDGMSNLPATLRKHLSRSFDILGTHCVASRKDTDGTEKFLLKLTDGHAVETVFLPRETAHTLCVSSQVGCALGCRFCATGAMGIVRNLTAAEIVSQILHVRHRVRPESHGNIVFMGMGEPLLNLDAVSGAIDRLTDPMCFGWSPRRITVSTAGVVPEIANLGRMHPTVNLAVSLNASDDRTRSRIMPINRKYPLSALMEALKAYPLPSRQHKITYEYILLRNINDRPADSKGLIRLLNPARDKINLIPFNFVGKSRFKGSDPETVAEFQRCLADAGFTVRIRNSQGASIDAACGQLAGRMEGVTDRS